MYVYSASWSTQSRYDVLTRTAMIEDALSVVWTERWRDYGDCEAVLPASESGKVHVGDFIELEGRRMLCEVVSVLAEDGRITVEGEDALKVLDRRIIEGTAKREGYVEGYVRDLIASVSETATYSDRRLPVVLGESAGITTTSTMQRSYRPIGEVCLEMARSYGFGVLAKLNADNRIEVACFQSGDKGLVLSSDFGNVASERILDDAKGSKNCVYVGGGDFSTGKRAVWLEKASGTVRGLGRKEEFLDRRDVPVSMPWDEFADGATEVDCHMNPMWVVQVAGGSRPRVELSILQNGTSYYVADARLITAEIVSGNELPGVVMTTVRSLSTTAPELFAEIVAAVGTPTASTATTYYLPQ